MWYIEKKLKFFFLSLELPFVCNSCCFYLNIVAKKNHRLNSYRIWILVFVTLPLLFVNSLYKVHLKHAYHQAVFLSIRNSIISLSIFRFGLYQNATFSWKFCNLCFLVCMFNKVSFQRMTTFKKKVSTFTYIELMAHKPSMHV